MFIIVSLFQLNQQTKKPAKGGEGIRRRGENPRKKGRERGQGGGDNPKLKYMSQYQLQYNTIVIYEHLFLNKRDSAFGIILFLYAHYARIFNFF